MSAVIRKILVVDDDPVVGKSFGRVLQAKGYIVVTAENGAEALAKLAKEEPDVVFTDIRMPGMDGLEVAERVKARRPWTPVVIVTGYGTSENEARARDAGVSDFIRKPLSPEAIEESTERALRAAPVIPLPTSAEPPPASEGAGAATRAAEPAAEEAPARPSRLKNAALFLVAPFVGLAYAVLLPFVGLGMLAYIVAEPWLTRPRVKAALEATRFFATMLAAPFIGLAYVVLAPFVGAAMLVWTAGKAIARR